MNVAGPSHIPPPRRRAPRDRPGSTYEEDLLRFLRELSPDEMDHIQTYFTHRARNGDLLSDYDIAMNDLLQQARALAIFNEDRALAQRIAARENVGVDQVPVRRPVVLPRANGDGTAIQRNGDIRRGPQANRNFMHYFGWLFSMLPLGRVVASELASAPSGANVNASTEVLKPPEVDLGPTRHDCVICQNSIHGSEIFAPCGHYYDIDCITNLFQSAMRDETLFPPRCCTKTIPFDQVRPHLSQALITTFQKKQLEFSTLKRVYCSSPTCSCFLGPVSENIRNVYTCPVPGCARRTCARCRGRCIINWMHVCRPNAGIVQVLKLGRTAGWARCPGCSQMIELQLGCNHMTCRCRTEFCYLCSARWKTCGCPRQGVVSRSAVKSKRAYSTCMRSCLFACVTIVFVFLALSVSVKAVIALFRLLL